MDRRFNAEFCVLCSRSLKCKNQYIPIQQLLIIALYHVLILDTLFKYKIVRKIEKKKQKIRMNFLRIRIYSCLWSDCNFDRVEE